MILLHLVVCALTLVKVFANDFHQQVDFFNGFEGVKRRLDTYTAKQFAEDSVLGDDDEKQWIVQKLDHFDSPNNKTWRQRFAERNQFYKDNNLAFLMIDGQARMSEGWFQHSFMSQLAEKYNAYMFIIEHRFYGASQPTDNISVDSLKYLSSDQALADYAHFIQEMNKKHKFRKAKWIVFGGFYAGSLATWMRYKYPDLVYAAVASSAPLQAQVNFPEYFNTVSHSLGKISSPKCSEAIRNANREISENIHDPEKRKTYRNLFDICKPFENNEKDISIFFATLANTVSGVVTFYRPEAKTHGVSANAAGLCRIMTDESIESPVERYAKWKKEIFGDYCLNANYSALVNVLNTTKYSFCPYRQYLYQTCNEFGWYQTSSKKNDIFGNKLPISYFTDFCKDVFNAKFDASTIDEATTATNKKYKGYSIPVSRVLFVHGSLDPWNPLGIKKKPPKGSYAIFIKGTSHCADMFVDNGKDLPQIKKAKDKISRIVKRWVNGRKEFLSEKESVFYYYKL